MNSVNIIGNLTRDVELAYAQSGTAIAKIGIALNKKVKNQQGGYDDKPIFVDATAFGKTGETLNQYFRRGSKIGIEGELNFEQWTDQQGQKRSKLSVIINRLHFLEKKDDSQNNQHPQQQNQQQPYNPQQNQQPAYNQPPAQNNQQQNYQPQQNQQQNYQQPQQNNQQTQRPQTNQQPPYQQPQNTQGRPNQQNYQQPNQQQPQQNNPQVKINEDEIPF